MPPVGEGVWGATRLVVPFAEEGEAFRNVFTGEVVRAAAGSGGAELALAEALASFPVALLERAERDSDGTGGGS